MDLIDLSEDAGPGHYQAAIQAANRDTGIDGLLVIYSPKMGQDPAAVAQAVAAAKSGLSKPLLTCWMGDAAVVAARGVLKDANIPELPHPRSRCGRLWQPELVLSEPEAAAANAAAFVHPGQARHRRRALVIESVLAERRKVLTEMESKSLLSAFHIPVTETLLARSAHEAMMIATSWASRSRSKSIRPTSRTSPTCRAWR